MTKDKYIGIRVTEKKKSVLKQALKDGNTTFSQFLRESIEKFIISQKLTVK